ncbi:hypothetical protein M758_1G189200 [Ceratodon purpureus]|nr:hypothetical protein M758_1G189200 [Ceratodon purpureus]
MCILLLMFCYFWKINCPVCMYKRLYFQFWQSAYEIIKLHSFATVSYYCDDVLRHCRK